MKTRKAVWLIANGVTNTLRRHFVNAGYRDGYETTVAKRHKCKPSEIPLSVISEYLGTVVESVERPDNWLEIMYGSKRGSKKEKPIGGRITTRQGMTKAELVSAFLKMRLSQSPGEASYY